MILTDVAVHLALLKCARIHDVFHVGLLKKFVGTPPAMPLPLLPVHNGATMLEPKRVVRVHFAHGVRQILIHWKGEPAAAATWEDLDSFRECYPSFQLKDELLVEGGEISCGASNIGGAHIHSRRRQQRGPVRCLS